MTFGECLHSAPVFVEHVHVSVQGALPNLHIFYVELVSRVTDTRSQGMRLWSRLVTVFRAPSCGFPLPRGLSGLGFSFLLSPPLPSPPSSSSHAPHTPVLAHAPAPPRPFSLASPPVPRVAREEAPHHHHKVEREASPTPPPLERRDREERQARRTTQNARKNRHKQGPVMLGAW